MVIMTLRGRHRAANNFIFGSHRRSGNSLCKGSPMRYQHWTNLIYFLYICDLLFKPCLLCGESKRDCIGIIYKQALLYSRSLPGIQTGMNRRQCVISNKLLYRIQINQKLKGNRFKCCVKYV